MNIRLVGPLCGVVFSVLFVVTVILVGDPGEGAEVAASRLTQDADRFLAAFLVGTLSALSLVGFFAWLRELVRHETRERAFLGSLVIAPAAAGAVLLSASLAMMSGAADAADRDGTSPEVAAMVMNVQFLFLVGGFMLAGLAVLCAGLGLLRSGLLPRWLCWAGVVVGVLQLLAFTFGPMLLLVLWVLVTGGFLLARASATDAEQRLPA